MMMTLASAQRPARLYAEPFARSDTAGWRCPVLDVEFDPVQACIWARLSETAPAHVSMQLLNEFATISGRIREGSYGTVKAKVISSRIPHIFSLGGDLSLFLRLIEAQDKRGLFSYGKAAIDEVWANISACGLRDLTTVALVNGEAQGGGFEAALSCHVIVAEEGSHFGFPESLFGLFPGMGASLLLAARTDHAVAERLIARADRYSAEFLQEIGVVDFVVPAGTGDAFVSSLVRSRFSRVSYKRQAQLEQISYNSLLGSVEQWVDSAMRLSNRHKRSMNYLLSAQRRMR